MSKNAPQLNTRHDFVVAKARPKKAATPAGITSDVNALIAAEKDPGALRLAILDYFNAHQARFDAAGLDAFFSALISSLPRHAEIADFPEWAHESRIRLAFKHNQLKRSYELYLQYLGDCAPPCDERFDQTYFAGMVATGSRLTPLRRRMRVYLLVQLLQRTLQRQGLVAECGCFRGLSSYVLCSYLKSDDPAFDGRGYQIFDSFAGLSVPQAEDAVDPDADNAARLTRMSQPGAFAASLKEVQNNLARYPGIEYRPGWIPQGFPVQSKAVYRFVHIDVDLYQPTLDCLEFFYPRLVPGGYIVSDDYNWPGARKAVEGFALKHSLKLHTTPAGQAYLRRAG